MRRKEKESAITMTNRAPRRPGATSSADSPADTELQGYSPPTPTPRTPRATTIIHSRPVGVVPLDAADNAAPRITKAVVRINPIFRPNRSIMRPKPSSSRFNSGQFLGCRLYFVIQLYYLPIWPMIAPTNREYERREDIVELNISEP